ncbi:MAG: lysophospholipid acyltransferase family protein [Acidimicrobiales bacterium]
MTVATSHTGVGRPGRRWEIAFYRVTRRAIWVAAKLLGRITVVGAENIPTHGSFVLAPVHRSNIDFALVALVTKRRMRYMGKDSIFRWQIPSKLVIALGAFPVHRGSADREALRVCIEVIDSGQPLVMFPEGTRQSGPVVEELFDGTVYVAGKTQVPIVPVGIGGSERVMPKGARMLHPAKLVLVVGEPIAPPPPTDGGRVGRKAIRNTTEELLTDIQGVFDLAQAMTGHPNAAPDKTS